MVGSPILVALLKAINSLGDLIQIFGVGGGIGEHQESIFVPRFFLQNMHCLRSGVLKFMHGGIYQTELEPRLQVFGVKFDSLLEVSKRGTCLALKLINDTQ